MPLTWLEVSGKHLPLLFPQSGVGWDGTMPPEHSAPLKGLLEFWHEFLAIPYRKARDGACQVSFLGLQLKAQVNGENFI